MDSTGHAQGLNPDLLREIARDETWQIEFVPGSWAEGLERLQKGDIDLMLSVAYSPERAEIMDYTYESVAELWGQVFVKPEGTFRNINDLAGRRVAVMRKDISAGNFITTAGKFAVQCEISEYASHAEVFAAVQKGEADAGVAPQHFGLRHAKEYNLVGSSIMFSPFSIFFAGKKGTQHELLSHIDAHLSRWKKEPGSFYYTRLDYWLGNQGAGTKIPLWLIYASSLGAVTILVFAVFFLLLRRTVKRRTKALQESEARYRDYIMNAPYGVFVADELGRYLQVNPFACRITGYEEHELLTMSIPDLLPEESREQGQRHFQTLRREGRSFDEMPFRPKNGDRRWWSVTAVKISDHRFLGFCNDITQRKEAEEKIRENTRLFDAVLVGTSDAIFVKDRAGRYLLANAGTSRAMGYEVAAIIGRTDDELLPPESLDIIHKAELKVMTTGLTVRAEDVIRNADGISYWLANKSPYYDENGEIIGIIGVAHDVTSLKKAEEEQHKLERQLQQAQKMEAIGTLAGGIAHDFNNILGALLGYAEMARDDSPPDSSVARDLGEILKAGHRAKDLVKQILTFSRQDAAERIPTSPGDIISEAVKMLRPSLPSTIDIRQDLRSDSGRILANPSQLHQVIINLCTNAYHAMEETGGILGISLKGTELTAEDLLRNPDIDQGKFIQISVSDTGAGMNPEIRERIFEPYFTTKETGKGTGLGLSIIHGIVKGHGGSISCSSKPGEGTVFHVFLPVINDDDLTETAVLELPHGGSEHILFIDDEEMLAEMAKTMLERLGYTVTVKNSSLEALTCFQNQPDLYDLVITDQTMPGMTGVDLARRLLQIRPELPIILCTGFSSQISEDRARAMGIREFALKPLSKKDIARLIRKVLDEANDF